MSSAFPGTNTASRIIETAQELIQTRGYNAFSYADIAKQLQISTASLHYHFPTKADLCLRLVKQQRQNLAVLFGDIDHSCSGAAGRLRRYADIYSTLMEAGCHSLWGMLAAEIDTLPSTVTEEVRLLFSDSERWLSVVLADGRESRVLNFMGTPQELARFVVGAFEGAILLARVHGNAALLKTTTDRLFGDIGLTAESN